MTCFENSIVIFYILGAKISAITYQLLRGNIDVKIELEGTIRGVFKPKDRKNQNF